MKTIPSVYTEILLRVHIGTTDVNFRTFDDVNMTFAFAEQVSV